MAAMMTTSQPYDNKHHLSNRDIDLTEQSILNLAGYLFVTIPHEELPLLRKEFQTFCKARPLKGTILLTPEGINAFLAGSDQAVEELLEYFKRYSYFQNLTFKISKSYYQPFSRMLVKIKKEIISFRQPGIDPSRERGASVEPKVLKQWLDEGRKIRLLDTRNDYETRVGTFKNAIDLKIKNFGEFAQATQRLEDLKGETIVMFCTGGIRCEKASLYMEKQGYKHIYQLEGGILKYFEDVGRDHYDGDCFVFDQRVAVGESLVETPVVQCFRCRNPLSAEEQLSEDYIPDVKCPYCA